VASARPHFRASVGTSLEDAIFVLHMIAKQIPYRYPNIKFMNDRLRPLRAIRGASGDRRVDQEAVIRARVPVTLRTGSRQLVEQRLRFLEVGVSKPSVNQL
jgi:hypothetical protein